MKIEKFDITKCATTAEVLDVTQQAWVPEDSVIYDMYGNPISTHKAILRSDTKDAIGIVGTKYHAMSLQDSFDITDILVKESGLSFEQLVMLDGGSKAIVSLNMDNITLKEGDTVKPRLNIIQSFDGSNSYQIFFSMLRIVCTNQLVSMMKDSTMKIRHTSSMPERLRLAEFAVQNAMDYFEHMTDVSVKMIRQRINEVFRDKILTMLFGEDKDKDGKLRSRVINHKRKVIELFKYGKGNEGQTAWDLLNGVTEYIDHHRGSNPEKREYSAEIGSGADLKRRAFTLLAA